MRASVKAHAKGLQLLEVREIVGFDLHLVDVYLVCSEAAEGGCELGLAEVMEGIAPNTGSKMQG